MLKIKKQDFCNTKQKQNIGNETFCIKKPPKQKSDLHKSTQQLQSIKNKINKCRKQIHCKQTNQYQRDFKDFHRYSDGQPFCQKIGRLEQGMRFDRFEKGVGREVLGSLKSIENYNLVSTIDMLKRQAELLDQEQDLGTIKKFSTLEHVDMFPQKQILLQVTKFRKQNIRKIAKGRPQLYNWVKNHKKQIAEMPYDYKTQSSKKCSKQLVNQKLQKLIQNKQIQKSKQKDRNSSSCKKSRRLTFIERLKRLQNQKQKGQMYQIIHKRRVHSQNEEQQKCQFINLKTLC